MHLRLMETHGMFTIELTRGIWQHVPDLSLVHTRLDSSSTYRDPHEERSAHNRLSYSMSISKFYIIYKRYLHALYHWRTIRSR